MSDHEYRLIEQRLRRGYDFGNESFPIQVGNGRKSKVRKMIDRRSLLLAAPAVFLATMSARPASADVGNPAGLDVYAAVQGLPGVSEGHGRGTLYVLYTPWCAEVPSFYQDTRAFLNDIAFKWIPFSGSQPEGLVGTEELLSSGTPRDIPRTFQVISPQRPAQTSFPLAQAQDARVASVIRLIVRDTGRGMATPTLVYRLEADRVRIHRGGLTTKGLRELSSYIA
jgi:hypothetical protein